MVPECGLGHPQHRDSLLEYSPYGLNFEMSLTYINIYCSMNYIRWLLITMSFLDRNLRIHSNTLIKDSSGKEPQDIIFSNKAFLIFIPFPTTSRAHSHCFFHSFSKWQREDYVMSTRRTISSQLKLIHSKAFLKPTRTLHFEAFTSNRTKVHLLTLLHELKIVTKR